MKKISIYVTTATCLTMSTLSVVADPYSDYARELVNGRKPIIAGISRPAEAGRTIAVYRSYFPEVDVKNPLVDIGSLTKFVTAVGILKLVEEGAFSLQTPISDLIENVPNDKAEITIHQLLIHSSGLLSSAGPDSEYLTRSELLAEAFDTPLKHRIGEEHQYSNVGYSVLAAIIELQSGAAYEDFLSGELLEPLGLPPMGYTSAYDDELSIRSARGFLSGFRHGTILETSWAGREPGWNLIGNGGLVTTAEGFLRFWNAFYDGDLLTSEMVETALRPHIDEGSGDTFYGYGLVVEPSDIHGHMFWHNGGGGVFSAEWRHLEASNVTLFTAAQRNYAFPAMSRWLENLR